ncbi:MAG: arylamine N-acetyltransferase, partial [Devosia sp.]
ADIEQPTPHEPYRLTETDGVWRVAVQIGEEWRVCFSFTLDEIDQAGLVAMNERVSSSPQFRDRLVAARAEKTRRVALLNNRLTLRPLEGEPEVRELTSTAELRDVLATILGIQLPTDERLEPALEKALASEIGEWRP